MKNAVFVLLVISIIESNVTFGQNWNKCPFEIEQYSFINYDTNVIIDPSNQSVLPHFFAKLDTLLLYGDGQINVIHVGGSHIQTDIYSNRMRQRLQHIQPGMEAARGLIFPVSIAQTNNPVSFSVSYTGNWSNCKNTERKRTCNIGLTGMTVMTSDSVATITIKPGNSSIPFFTDKIRVLHNDNFSVYQLNLITDDGYLINSIDHFPDEYYTEITLNYPVDSFSLEFYKTADYNVTFELYGIDLKNDDSGIIYHSLGVNGASIPSFLRCKLLQDHTQLLNPDLVILSLGTNDAYSRRFDPDVYKNNLDRLISLFKEVNPDVDILLTVPNDVLFRRRHINTNTALQEEVIYDLAVKHDCAVWNFYQVMGGLNSISEWYSRELAQRDRIHFTTPGYILKGDLFFYAMMKSYGDYLQNKKKLMSEKSDNG